MDARVASLAEAVGSFCAFIRGLSPTRLARSTDSEWGPREVLIHLAHWHPVYVSTVRALIDGRPPELPAGTFKALNASSVQADASAPVAELLRRLETAQRELEALAPEASARHLSFSFRAGSMERTFDDAVRLIDGHVRLHHRRIAAPPRLPRRAGRRPK